MKIGRAGRVESAPPSLFASARTNVSLHTWGSHGCADGQFSSPSGIAVSMSDIIVVSDSDNHRIQCFRSNGAFLRKWGTRGRGDGKFHFPAGLSIGLCQGTNAAILNAIHHVPQLAAFPPGLAAICAAFIGDECIYVADTHNHRIQVFNMDGRYVRKWGTPGDGDGQFKHPISSSVDHYQNILYVADLHNHRIQAFDHDGTFILKWGSHARGTNHFMVPESVSASRNGLIYVAAERKSIQRYRQDGVIQGEWRPSSGACVDILVDDTCGLLYALVISPSCVLQYRLTDGALVHKLHLRRTHDTKFLYLQCIAKGLNGILYLTDVINHRVMALQFNVCA